ncbi:MAG: DUF2061 domain-containing protein [Rhizobiales bacterium]|nr:DUF2061 domain-containing protein [Hyphomicrobiales bacterium]MBI3672792.1 DUF2061 domain-containing protein [Hyphomicrobiales bacterium]
MTDSNQQPTSSVHAVTEIIDKKASASVPRSMVKTITWRALGSLDTLTLGFIFTGSLKIAGSIASAEVITKIVLYYLHERGWAHIRWGRQ